MKKVIVIGAGASGVIAGAIAAKNGNKVIILEKMPEPLKKLLISGKGRCNITNSADIDTFIENTPGNGHFLYSAFYTFFREDILEILQKEGVKTKLERGGRVFPVSDSSRDVANALLNFAKKNGAKIICNSKVKDIMVNDRAVSGVKLENGSIFEADSVIIATGGMSYPGTGSDGDGYKFAAKLGHKVTELRPSLVGLITEEKWVQDLQGLSLKNVEITLRDSSNKKVYSDFGEMLFTHFGVSGPIILSASRVAHKYIKSGLNIEGLRLNIDLKPALDFEKLEARVIRDFDKYSKKQLKNAMDDLLPKRLIPVVIQLSGIDEDKFVNQITKQERRKIIEVLKGLSLTITRLRPIAEAIVTAGGIEVDEVNPSTMESKLVKGLHFCGEVMDLDAYTGGFNLQIAFSTGYLAGSSI